MAIFSRKKTNRVKPAPRKRTAKKKAAKKMAFQWPDLRPLLRSLKTLVMVGAIGTCAVFGWRVLDRPVTAIEVTAPFQRVTPMQIEDYVRSGLGGGVLSGDLDGVRASLEALDWVDTVRIRRSWPSRLTVQVNEQVAAARWGDNGLLNTRGELFVDDARHIPAELPLLRGPHGTQWQVAQRYLTLRGPLLESGLQLLAVTLNERGSWQLTMAHGIDVRLGSHAVDERIERFLSVVTPMIIGRTEVVDYVDLRYSNGFAIGWNDPADTEDDTPQATAQLAQD